jgi:hypothetical protein
MGAGVDGREVGDPDVLKDAEDAELPLLVDEGVVGENGEVDLQANLRIS